MILHPQSTWHQEFLRLAIGADPRSAIGYPRGLTSAIPAGFQSHHQKQIMEDSTRLEGYKLFTLSTNRR